jgi:hypothetical protein
MCGLNPLVMIKPAKFLLPLAIVLSAPSLSRADLSITLGNNPQPGEENVLLNTGTTGNTVLGTLNQSGLLVNFTSSQVLTEPSNGQARIEATNNSSQVAVTDISFSLANGTFTDAIFNPFIGGTIGSPGDATITVMGQDAMANPETFTGTFSLGNGGNFFTVVASNGEVIDSISLSAINGFGFTDLRQVRISGATVPSVPETGTTLSLLGAGVLALALLRRKLVCLADGSGT